MKTRPVGIFYEHPAGVNPLFEELQRRNIPFVRIHAASHQYNPAATEEPFRLLINAVRPSAKVPGRSPGIFHSAHYISHTERLGIRVINGSTAHDIESSKIRQIELLAGLGLQSPRSKVVNHVDQIVPAALTLRFPVIVKINRAGQAGDTRKFASLDALKKSIEGNRIDLGIDHTIVIQEFIPARDREVVRVETLNGKFLYAIKTNPEEDKPILQPYSPPQQIVKDVERIVKAARIDIGAVEYVISAVNEQVYFTNITTFSNYIDNAEEVIGFDPYLVLADYVSDQLKPIYEFDLAPGALDEFN
jgi:carbamoylphosphate synthase large subunit